MKTKELLDLLERASKLLEEDNEKKDREYRKEFEKYLNSIKEISLQD